MKNQEAFDFVYKKIVEQGGGSFVPNPGYYPVGEKEANESAVCSYRGPFGRRCAAGWLMPDEVYKRDYEGLRANRVGIMAGADLVFQGLSPLFVDDLQCVHDRSVNQSHDDKSFLIEFKNRMVDFARVNFLNTKAIEAA